MKRTGCFFNVLLSQLILIVGTLSANDPLDPARGKADTEHGLIWFDALEIGIEGQGWQDRKAPFDRLPAKAEGVVRPPVWELSRHSAGLCLRFATSAPAIHARWSLLSSQLAMPHMPATGVSGLDLYVKTDAGWRWLANGRPSQQTNNVALVSGLPEERREYQLFLPLYNGVTSLEIGIPAQATLHHLRRPVGTKPLVFWGTSITQGGCASRPGMVHTAILGRRLDRPVINLGFSGNGKLEPEMAALIAEIDASVFVLDCLPNLDAGEVSERTEPAVRTIRAAHPKTPILLVEDRDYSDAFLVSSKRQRNLASQAALKRAYDQMVKDGIQELYYLPGKELFGSDGEDTVDSSHPTDLGFLRMADAFERRLQPVLQRSP